MPTINDNGVDRPMTAEEVAAYEERAATTNAEQAALEQQIADALEARKAPLRRLGLTDEEIDLVLGL
jgi:hypothetical protein